MANSRIILAFFMLAAGALAPGVAIGQLLGEEEKRGRSIYLTGGSSAGGPVPAFLGKARVPVPPKVAACVNCHGPDGRGIAEGGVNPSNITWHELTKPYGSVSGNLRRRAPYTEASLRKALRDGIDSSGARLEDAMPRYQLTEADGQALIAYLKMIERVQDPGVTSRSVRVGVVLPPAEVGEPIAANVRGALRSYFERSNASGGIYRRNVELAFLELDRDSSRWFQQWKGFLETQELFALLSPSFGSEPMREIEQLVTAHGIPALSPITASPVEREIPNPLIFYFYPGKKRLNVALLQFAEASLKIDRQAIVELNSQGGLTLQKTRDLKASGTKALLLANGAVDSPAVLEALSAANWRPVLLLPVSSANAKLLPLLARYTGPVYVAFPDREAHLPGDPKRQIKSALVAAEVFRDLLLNCGRKLTRRKLLALLEEFHAHETGWSGPLTFSPNRRIGATGAYIGQLDRTSKTWVPATEWVELTE